MVEAALATKRLEKVGKPEEIRGTEKPLLTARNPEEPVPAAKNLREGEKWGSQEKSRGTGRTEEPAPTVEDLRKEVRNRGASASRSFVVILV